MAHADFVDRFLLARFLRFALGLDFAQHFEHLLVLAHQALFVDGEREQRVFRAAQRFGENEGGLRFGMIDVPELGIFGEADGEEVVLGRHDAVQPVLQLGEHVDQVLLLRVGRADTAFRNRR